MTTYIDDLGEAMDTLDQSINLLKSALATVEMQKNVAATIFAKLEKAQTHQYKQPTPVQLPPGEGSNLATINVPVAATPQMPQMPGAPLEPAKNTWETAHSEPTAVPPPDTKTDPTKSPPETLSDSEFTLAITKMSRSYNGFLGGEVTGTLAWFGIQPPNGVLNVPPERRYEFLEVLEANAKEGAAG